MLLTLHGTLKFKLKFSFDELEQDPHIVIQGLRPLVCTRLYKGIIGPLILLMNTQWSFPGTTRSVHNNLKSLLKYSSTF